MGKFKVKRIYMYVIIILISCICFYGCNDYEEEYSKYKELIDTNDGYDEVKERVRVKGVVYALIDSDDMYSYNDTILKYDTKKDDVSTYGAGVAINGICADEKYVYYINTKHNGSNDSYISKVNVDIFDSKNKKNMDCMVSNEYKNIVLTHIEMCDDKLYAFGFDYDMKGVYSKMYIIDKENLSCMNIFDFSDYIIDVTDACKVKDKLYVAGRSARKLNNKEYEEIDNKYIYEIDLSHVISSKDKVRKDLYSSMIRKIYIGDITYEIKYEDGEIYVSSYDEVLDEGNSIYVISNLGEVVKKRNFTRKVRDINVITSKHMK